MKNLTSYATAIALLVIPSLLIAQSRDLRSERIVLDDNSGNTIVVQTPAGPITGGTLTIPDPGGAGQFLISNPSGGSQSVSGDLLPGADDTYDLGSGAARWQDIFASGNISVGGQTRYVETGGGTDYVGFQAPAAVTANQVWTLPAADGAAGQALVTDGSGILSWAAGAVTTNSTLLGDGSGGDPLRFNLSNTNTWTGTQTFGQVSVLSIATFDADVTLGDSPTDALTMNGTLAGATPLSFEGATSDVNETTFAMTDPTADRIITFQDASGTVAFLSDVAVTTNSTLLGDGTGGDPLRFNLSNTNTWTGAQTFGQVSVLSIATFDADVTLGDSPTDALTMNGTLAGATPLSFEGATSDVNETTFAMTDPTADRIITFQDASGTVAFLSDVAVTTNSTLLGDGTGGDPLRLNLSNTNTWTGAQTFSGVDINGGSVDGAAIGSGSPSTGAFTTITGGSTVTLGDDLFPTRGRVILHDNLDLNGFQGTVQTASVLTGNRTYTLPDASGTLVVSGTETVSTNSTLTGNGSSGSPLGIDLTNANSWTGAQTFSGVDINGGSVDGAAIGSASPSTGAFTTITGGSTVTLGDDLFPTRGRVILHDNLDLNGFQGTVQTASVLTGNRTYTLPDASGTLLVNGQATVSTNSTLLGDGSGGDPLRINLANTNAWSAAQSVTTNSGTTSTLLLSNTNATGVGLEVSDGRTILAYGNSTATTIPSDVSVWTVDDEGTAAGITVALPGTATNGQILYVLYDDANAGSVGGTAAASGDTFTFVYANGAWNLFHQN